METIVPVQSDTATPVAADVAAVSRLDQLLLKYSKGQLGRKELEQASGLWFGEILAELGRRGWPLPRVDSTVHFNAAQRELYRQVFG